MLTMQPYRRDPARHQSWCSRACNGAVVAWISVAPVELPPSGVGTGVVTSVLVVAYVAAARWLARRHRKLRAQARLIELVHAAGGDPSRGGGLTQPR